MDSSPIEQCCKTGPREHLLVGVFSAALKGFGKRITRDESWIVYVYDNDARHAVWQNHHPS